MASWAPEGGSLGVSMPSKDCGTPGAAFKVVAGRMQRHYPIALGQPAEKAVTTRGETSDLSTDAARARAP